MKRQRRRRKRERGVFSEDLLPLLRFLSQKEGERERTSGF
jgi:hypothetical protein